MLCTCRLFHDLPRIGNIRLSFKDAQLLLVGLLSLRCHPSRTVIAVLLRRNATPIPDLCLIDSTLRIGVVLDIALKGVGAFELLQFVRAYACHRRSLRAADQRIAHKIDIRGPVQFCVFATHDLILRSWILAAALSFRVMSVMAIAFAATSGYFTVPPL